MAKKKRDEYKYKTTIDTDEGIGVVLAVIQAQLLEQWRQTGDARDTGIGVCKVSLARFHSALPI